MIAILKMADWILLLAVGLVAALALALIWAFVRGTGGPHDDY